MEPPSKALRNPLRVRIVAACNESELTAEEFAKSHRISTRAANNHFRALEKAGFLRRREVRVRGVTMHVYSTVQEPVITDPEFAEMQMKERRSLTETIIRDFFSRCLAAWRAGTLDGREDSHFTWLPLRLDLQGWKEATQLLLSALDRLYEIQAESSRRLRESEDAPISTIFGLAGFESPTKPQGYRPDRNGERD